MNKRLSLSFRRFDHQLTHTWMIASNVATGGKQTYPAVFVELRDSDGVLGIGEAAPSSRYAENVDTVAEFLRKVDASRLSFDDVEGSMAYVESITLKDFSGKGAINIALPNYQREWRPLGFADADFANGGSDRLIDATIAWGDAAAIRKYLDRHFAAGATQVCIHAIGAGGPMSGPNWQILEALAPGR